MALDLGTLVARIQLNAQQAQQELEDFRGRVDKVADGIGDVGKKLVGVGSAGVGAIAGLAIAGGEWQANIEGTKFMYNQLDKAIQSNIDKHSKEASALGLTSQQYTDAGVKLATYYKNMGLTTTQIDDMLASNMQLVADLGAITDVPFDDAMNRFKSALMGNHEAVDALNVNLSDSMMNESKYAKSIGKTTQKMTEQEKMLARLSVIQEQGAVATGLASQEAEGFSMKLKLITQKIKELVGKIGATLLPILTPLLQAFEKGVDKITAFVDANGELVGKVLAVVGAISALLVVVGSVLLAVSGGIGLFGSLVGAVGRISGAFSTAMGWFSGLGTRIMGLIGRVPLLTRGLGLLRGAFAMLTSPMGLLVGGILLVSGALLLFGDDLNGVLGKVGEFLTGMINTISANLPSMLQKGIEIISMILTGLMIALPQILNKGIEILIMLVNGIAQALPMIIESAIAIINTLANFIVTNLPTIIDIGVQLLTSLVNGLISALPMLIAGAVMLIGQLVMVLIQNLPKLLEAGKQLLQAVVNGIISLLGSILEAGGQIIQSAWNGITNGLGKLIEAGKSIVSSILDGIKSAWGGITSWISSGLSKLPIVGGFFKIGTEVEEPTLPNTRGLETAYKMRNSLLGDLNNVGASIKSSQRVTVKSDNNNILLQAINKLSDTLASHETTINTSVNLDGREIARGTASYIKDEIDMRTRRMNRLGGVL